VHSDGYTALDWAAHYGNRRIVRLLIAFKADVNAQSSSGCAVSASAMAACGGRVPPHLPCRFTPLHRAAYNGRSDVIAELLMRGADGAVQDNIYG
jgi:ankyrin repeat protein